MILAVALIVMIALSLVLMRSMQVGADNSRQMSRLIRKMRDEGRP